jgi:mitogen-activated protein kinase organizer 1
LSGSEAAKEDGTAPGAAVFAWDVLSGKTVATVPMGEKVKAVSCVAWNEQGYWAGGCSDGKIDSLFLRVYLLTRCPGTVRVFG